MAINTLLMNGHDADNGLERKIYLVTGASRGIGKGLVARLLQRERCLVIACVRSPEGATAVLEQLPKANGAELIVVRYDCASRNDAAEMAETLRSRHGVSRVDVVIANAAMAAHYGPTSTLPLDELEAHMMVNTYSVLLLFQATLPMLQKAEQQGGAPQFVFIGAPISTITQLESVARAPLGAYSVTKLAANYLVRKWHFENKWLMAYVVDPGHVQTDMGAQGARLMGRAEAPTTIDASVSGICAQIDGASKEKTSGRFVMWEDGSAVPW